MNKNKENEMSVVLIPVVGIRAGAYRSKYLSWRPDPSDNEVLDYMGPCSICNWYDVYGDAGNYCSECN
jgi:hypothetical protein